MLMSVPRACATRVEGGGLGAVEDTAKGHDGGLTVAPLGAANALLDEGHDGLDDGVGNVAGEKLETGRGGHRLGPLVLVGVLLLLGEELEENGKNLVEGHLGKVLGHDGGLLAVRERLLRLNADLNLLLADGRPELDGLERDGLLGVLHAHDGEAEESALHVELHELVV
jgi:hypothetical protein